MAVSFFFFLFIYVAIVLRDGYLGKCCEIMSQFIIISLEEYRGELVNLKPYCKMTPNQAELLTFLSCLLI